MFTTEVNYIFIEKDKSSAQEKTARPSGFPEIIIGSPDDLILEPFAIMQIVASLFVTGAIVGFLIAVLTSS